MNGPMKIVKASTFLAGKVGTYLSRRTQGDGIAIFLHGPCRIFSGRCDVIIYGAAIGRIVGGDCCFERIPAGGKEVQAEAVENAHLARPRHGRSDGTVGDGRKNEATRNRNGASNRTR